MLKVKCTYLSLSFGVFAHDRNGDLPQKACIYERCLGCNHFAGSGVDQASHKAGKYRRLCAMEMRLDTPSRMSRGKVQSVLLS